MALPSSGPISISAINVELGNSPTALGSMNSSPFRGLAAKASGTISLANFYAKQLWTLVTGTYASNTFITNRAGFTPGPTYTSPAFGAVRPKTININIRLTQYDWIAPCSWILEVYYESSGWITVDSAYMDINAGQTYTLNKDIALTRAERATQYRFTANSRANSDSQTIKFTEWYTRAY